MIMAGLAAVLWTIEILNVVDDYSLNRFGLKPRQFDGLDGVVTMPFLHAGVGHLFANTFPFVIIGWMVLIGGVREFLWATLIIVIGGGLATWVVGPSGSANGHPVTVVGASGLVFGWLAYLLARAYFARKAMWIIAAIFALFFFGGLFGGLLPNVHSEVAWQAHVCGFAAGILAGWIIHPAKGSSRALKRGIPHGR
ncbi:MAG: peptidase family protein [Pseudonocardiales bacterium]|nr:peptidase family protein [Pseudonocardiales bacterium]